MRSSLDQVKYGQAAQSLKFDNFLPYLHVDNPTNARIVLPNGQSIGPYTLNAVVSTPATQGSFTVDTSDVSYPNVSIFSNAQITMWLTNDEAPSPGTTYAPIANISSTVTVSGNVNATVTNTINATIVNASINVNASQSGSWSVNANITNATISVAQSGTWNVNANITNATISVTQSGTWNINATISNSTIAVTQSGTWNVGINGNVTIGNIIAGTVTFSNSQINVQNVPATLLNTNSIQVSEGTLVVAANGNNNANFNVPPGCHTIGIVVENAASIKQLIVTGVQSGTVYLSLPPFNSTVSSLQGYFVAPILSAIDTQVNINAASIGGATLGVVAILDTEATYVFNNVSQPSNVILVSSAGIALGDTSAPTLSSDSVTEVNNTANTSTVMGVIASFKPASAGTAIALVGVVGAMTTGTNTAVTGAFGQATVATHLLVCCVSCGSSGTPTTAAAGWVQAVIETNGNSVAIWYKPNCGAGEAAPAFTAVGSTTIMFAQLFEFSGVATSSPLDQTGTNTNASQSLTDLNNAIDGQVGDLVINAVRYILGTAVTPSVTDTINNNATIINAGVAAQNGQRSQSDSYAIIPSAKTALPVGTQVWPYDSQGSSAPGAGTAPSVTLAANPTKKYILAMVSADMIQGGATADVGDLLQWTTFQARIAVIAGAGNYWHKELVGISQAFAVNTAVVVSFGGISATCNGSIVIGAYLR